MNKTLKYLILTLIITFSFTTVNATAINNNCEQNCLDFYIVVRCENQIPNQQPPQHADLSVWINKVNTTFVTEFHLFLEVTFPEAHQYNALIVDLPNHESYHYRFSDGDRFISEWGTLVVPSGASMLILDKCTQLHLPMVQFN